MITWMRGVVAFALGLCLIGFALPAMAAPDCPMRKRDKDEPFLEKPPSIPKQFRKWVKASKTDLSISTLSGQTLCVKLGWIFDPNKFWISKDQRFIGFDILGFEYHGHVVIDRSGKGQEIATGERPIFSPDKSKFAFAQLSDSGWGNFEGVAIWSVDSNKSTKLISIENDENSQPLPYGIDWKVDRWSSEDAVALSMIHSDDYFADENYAKSVIRSPRRLYRLERREQKWQLRDCATDGPC